MAAVEQLALEVVVSRELLDDRIVGQVGQRIPVRHLHGAPAAVARQTRCASVAILRNPPANNGAS